MLMFWPISSRITSSLQNLYPSSVLRIGEHPEPLDSVFLAKKVLLRDFKHLFFQLFAVKRRMYLRMDLAEPLSVDGRYNLLVAVFPEYNMLIK